MGCNYYLRKKAKYDEDVYDENISKIKNGILFKDYFYPTVHALNDDYYKELHIGKSSYGWHFLLCAYADKNINTLEDWVREFNEPDAKIYNEYNEEVPPEELVDIITNRQSSSYVEGETRQQQIERENKFVEDYNQDSVGHKIKSYNEFLAHNFARRGKNGLLSHLCAEETDGTYDITFDTDFS